MKRTFTLLLAMTLVFSLCSAADGANLPKLTFEVTSEGAETSGGINELSAKTGDVITFELYVYAGAETAVSTLSDEIYYDHSFFELVSFEAETTYETSAQTYSGGERYVFFNTINTHTYDESPVKVGEFKLKVIASSGSSTVSSKNCAAYQTAADSYAIQAIDTRVSVTASQTQAPTSGGGTGESGGEEDEDESDSAEEPETPDKAEAIADVDNCALGEDCPTGEFTDAPATQWYHAGIHYCVEMGYMNGTGGGSFSPSGKTSRAMIVAILYRMAGSPEVDGGVTFGDVAAGQWYYNAVLWASQNGIVDGYSEEQFDPNGSITREQFAAILYRYATFKGCDMSGRGDLSGFSDGGSVSAWAETAVSWANSAGLINGRDSGDIAPTADAVRAEAATLIYRFDTNIIK